MASLECERRTHDDVTLVELTLESDVAARVELRPTHGGPLWPPRRQGVAERGWSADGWTGVVPADEPLALGYATPADPDDPPVRVAGRGPPPTESDPASPRDVIRALGDPRPPRDAVGPRDESGHSATEGTASATDGTASATGPAADGGAPHESRGGDLDLDAVAARIDRAESLATVDSADAAREAVAAAGGVDAVADLADRLDRDRERLDAQAERVARLRERADLEVPLEALVRLA